MQIGKYTVRDYQLEQVNACRSAFVNGDNRIVLCSPTGSGKQTVGCAIMQLAIDKGKRVLFLADARQLIFQKSQRLTDCGISHSVLMSGEEYSHSSVTVASRDTLWSRSFVNESIPLPVADLIIIDECHKSLSSTYQNILRACPHALVLGMTATAAGRNGFGLLGFYDRVIQTTTIDNLVQKGYLVDIPEGNVFSPYRPDMDSAGSGYDWTDNQAELVMDKDRVVGNIVTEWESKAQGRPTVVFCCTVKHSVHVCEEFNGRGHRWDHIDADTPQHDREHKFKMLRDGDIDGLSNVGVLTTGWDEPCVSCAVLARPTKSLVLYLQCVGRIMRPYPGKTDAMVIDHSGAVHRHGWPTDDRDWNITESERIEVKELERNERSGGQEYRVCPKCAAMWLRGIKCPNCGFERRKRGQDVEMADGTLRPAKKRKSRNNGEKTLESYWSHSLAIAANRGGSYRMAIAIFHNKTGAWPDASFKYYVQDESQRGRKVANLFPGFVRGKKAKA